MYLKQERPEMDDFERKIFGCEGKIQIFEEKNYKNVFNIHFLAGGGGRQPPPSHPQ